jgi:hypothetical protein
MLTFGQPRALCDPDKMIAVKLWPADVSSPRDLERSALRWLSHRRFRPIHCDALTLYPHWHSGHEHRDTVSRDHPADALPVPPPPAGHHPS